MIERTFSKAFLGVGLVLTLAVAACGSDDDEPAGSAGGGGQAGTGGTAGTTADGGGSAGSTAGSAGVSGGAGSSGAAGTAGSPDAGPTETYAALVRGTLFTTDLDEAKTTHDALASGGEASAKAVGDIAHDVLLGTSLLGGTENSFLAMDRWTNAQGMDTFYADPAFQQGFGPLFAEPPTFEQFIHQPGWVSWGDLNAGDGFDPYYFAVVRGRLAESDPVAAQAGHDAVAAAGQDAAAAVGDVAHVVFTGRQDPQELLAIDVWSSVDAIETFYGNPDFQAAFGALFEEPPTLDIHRSTDWHQW
jgi:quinol monooxygenase YgiN